MSKSGNHKPELWFIVRPSVANLELNQSQTALRILITNAYLEKYGGVEVVVRDLAAEFQRQGHEPMVYSPHLGDVAEEIRNLGVEIADDLHNFNSVPDVIHGHQFPELLQAVLHFSSTPAVYVCHTAMSGVDEPFVFPRILRYVAVDRRCKKRLEQTPGIDAARIEQIENAVDLTRYRLREPLPEKPSRALIFSNYATSSTHLLAIREACRRKKIELDVVGIGAGTATKNPELILPRYHLVFAKARCAMEAIATGCAVILCDFAGSGPMVSTQNFDALRRMNFGQGVLTNPLRPEYLEKEMDHYDFSDAAQVSARIREEADLVVAAQRWLQLYATVIKEFDGSPRDFSAEMQAIESYLHLRSYESRVEWEKQQIRKLQKIPAIGNAVFSLTRKALQYWTAKS